MIPMDDRDGYIWFDGKMVPWREAKIHVLTHGLHYASAVFEGVRAYGGQIFKLTQHSERLANSARLLGFSLPFTTAELDAAWAAYTRAAELAGKSIFSPLSKSSPPASASPCESLPINVALTDPIPG